MRSFLALLACVVAPLVAGCTSTTPAPATDRELEPVDMPANPTISQVTPANTTATRSNRPEPVHGKEGIVATIIYVTEIGNRGGPKRPGAVIFSSDLASKYLQDRPRPSRILKPLDPGRMQQILNQLREAGLDRLPYEAQLVDEAITADRQFIVLRDEKRVTYRLNTMKTNAEAFKVFNACEKVLVNASHESDEFVETMGREATQDFKPLHPELNPDR